MRASTSDDAVPGSSNPVPIPNPGQKAYSYWITLQLETLQAPDTLLDNVRLWTDGVSSWPGVETYVALASDYVQASGTPGVSGLPLNSTNHPELQFEPVPIWNFTQSSPLVIPGSTATTETFGSLIVIQLVSTAQAIRGTLPIEPFSITWDES